jgi:hypothetical protein
MELINQLAEVAKNLELAKEEPAKPVSGEMILFQKALSQPRIIQGERENLVKTLRWIMMKVGLREQNWPTTEETAVLIQHIESNYGGHTVEELRLAFDMAINGKLEVDPICYENFSCLYFSKIMGVYREWAIEEYKEIESKYSFKQIEYKEDMSREAMMDWFEATAKKIRAGEMLVDFVPEMLYVFMDENGNISATKEEKYQYLQRAAEYRQGQLQSDVDKNDTPNNRWRLSTFITQKNNGYFEGQEADRVKLLAKKMLLYDTILKQPA